MGQVVSINDGLKRVVKAGAVLEKVVGKLRLTAGAVYDGRGDVLYFSDRGADTVYRYYPGRRVLEVYRQPAGVPSGNTFDGEGRLITCEYKTRRVSRTDGDGRIVTLAFLVNGKRLNSPHDIVRRADGTLYFTDPPYGLPERNVGKELDVNGIYRIGRDGNTTLVARDLILPSGLAFSPDEKLLYVMEASGSRSGVRVYDVGQDGRLSGGRVFAVLKTAGKMDAPDGVKVDTRGNVFATGPGGVWIFAPDGRHLGTLETPEAATDIAFGDRDFKTLYITASTSLYRIRLQVAGIRAKG